MPRSKANFRQSDARRAIAANESLGAPNIIEILPDGVIRLIPNEIAKAMMAKKADQSATLAADDSGVLES